MGGGQGHGPKSLSEEFATPSGMSGSFRFGQSIWENTYVRRDKSMGQKQSRKLVPIVATPTSHQDTNRHTQGGVSQKCRHIQSNHKARANCIAFSEFNRICWQNFDHSSHRHQQTFLSVPMCICIQWMPLISWLLWFVCVNFIFQVEWCKVWWA